jgi:hypothetical protein
VHESQKLIGKPWKDSDKPKNKEFCIKKAPVWMGAIFLTDLKGLFLRNQHYTRIGGIIIHHGNSSPTL